MARSRGLGGFVPGLAAVPDLPPEPIDLRIPRRGPCGLSETDTRVIATWGPPNEPRDRTDRALRALILECREYVAGWKLIDETRA